MKKVLKNIVLAAIVAALFIPMTAVADDTIVMLDPTLESDLNELERVKALLEAANERCRVLEAAQANSTGSQQDLIAAREENERIKVLLAAVNGQLAAFKTNNAELLNVVADLKSKLSVATRAAEAGPAMTVRARPHIVQAQRAAHSVLGRLDNHIVCVAMYEVGKYEVNASTQQCVDKALKVAQSGHDIGLVGFADEIRCQTQGKTHSSCNRMLADLRVSRFNQLLANGGFQTARALPGVGNQRKGLRAVVVWDLGPNTESVVSHFESQFQTLNKRVGDLEDDNVSQWREIDGLRKDVDGIIKNGTVGSTSTRSFSYAAIELAAGVSVHRVMGDLDLDVNETLVMGQLSLDLLFQWHENWGAYIGGSLAVGSTNSFPEADKEADAGWNGGVRYGVFGRTGRHMFSINGRFTWYSTHKPGYSDFVFFGAGVGYKAYFLEDQRAPVNGFFGVEVSGGNDVPTVSSAEAAVDAQALLGVHF